MTLNYHKVMSSDNVYDDDNPKFEVNWRFPTEDMIQNTLPGKPAALLNLEITDNNDCLTSIKAKLDNGLESTLGEPGQNCNRKTITLNAIMVKKILVSKFGSTT